MRIAAAVIAWMVLAAPAGAFEHVQIPYAGGTLKAALFRPEGDGPFPAVVGLHGCSGLGGRAAAVGPIYRDWGERLAAAGFVVLFPDSFGSRGAGPQCSVRERAIRPRVERVVDANAARHWLQGQPWVRQDRVFLVGWSHGGSTTLWTVRPQAAGRDAGADFRSAVAF
jgi:dienelactone hydrolase